MTFVKKLTKLGKCLKKSCQANFLLLISHLGPYQQFRDTVLA